MRNAAIVLFTSADGAFTPGGWWIPFMPVQKSKVFAMKRLNFF